MKHENTFDARAAVPRLPEHLKGTRAALFHLLREEPAPQPKRVATLPQQIVTVSPEQTSHSIVEARWDTVLAADDFQFLD